jgi:aspartyl-tRNA(Asn)/glutamyl-tRNA(Gln) amidotransferase subunit A
MSDLAAHHLWQLADLLGRGEVGAEEVCKAYLERIEKYDDRLGAYISVQPESALAQAREVDRRRAAGEETGPLAGVPLAIKDVICLEGFPTTCGSRILENFVPPFDATAVARLRRAGAVFLGKTNMDEFAMGSSNEWSAYRPARNPWDTERIPGGSSGGSAVAVAARLAAGALGSDTGGSVRQPASLCGIYGLLPTYGRVSRFGLVAFGSSLDHICPMTRSVRDAAVLLGVIAGLDPHDSTSLPDPVPDYAAELKPDLKGRKLGVPKEVFGGGLDAEVRAAFERTLKLAEELGGEVLEIELPMMKYGVPAYYISACAEASSNLARYDGIRYGLRVPGCEDLRGQYRRTRTAGFGPEVKRRIMLGTFVLSSGYYEAYYSKGIKVRALIKAELEKAFQSVDFIATPTAPTPAFRLGEKLDDPVQMYLSDIFTVTADLAGIPAASINCAFSAAGLPIGFQLMAPHLREQKTLNASLALEETLNLPQNGPEID